MFSENKLSLEEWMLKAREFNIPELNSFVNGIKRDIDSVKNSFTSRYSNGLLEGKINKVKGIKRMSYGGCKRTTILLTKSHKKIPRNKWGTIIHMVICSMIISIYLFIDKTSN